MGLLSRLQEEAKALPPDQKFIRVGRQETPPRRPREPLTEYMRRIREASAPLRGEKK